MQIWQRMPPLSALRAFAAWVESGSMTAAGAALNVSHAAISQQIRGLEAHLGLTLIDRGQSPPRLSVDGERLAEAVMTGFEGIARRIDEMAGADAMRPVQITTSPSFASAWLMPRLARLRQAHPGISLMIDPTPELRNLTAGGIDLAVRYGAGDWPGLDVRPLLPTPLVVVGAPILVGNAGPGSLASLPPLPWLQELGTEEATSFLERMGIGRSPDLGMVSLPGGMMLDAARDGQGLAVISRAFVEADVAAGRLRVLHEEGHGKGYWLVHRPGLLRPQAKAVLRWLAREGALARGDNEPH